MADLVEPNRLEGVAGSKRSQFGVCETIWVVVVAALAVRTFFLHPMSIPSASMEPTFRGARVVNIKGWESDQSFGGIRHWMTFALEGVRDVRCRAKTSGRFEIVDPQPVSVFGVGRFQRFRIGAMVHKVWFPPANLWLHAELRGGEIFGAR